MFLKFICGLLFRVRLDGASNFAGADGGALVVANRLSSIDALLLALCLPGLDALVVRQGEARWLPGGIKVFRLGQGQDDAGVEAVASEIRNGKKCLMFPEDRVGSATCPSKVCHMAAAIADKADAMVLPVRVDGTQHSLWSGLGGTVRRLFPRVSISILPPCRVSAGPQARGGERLRAVADRLYDVMGDMMFASSDYRKPLFQSLLDQARLHGRGHVIAEDIKRQPMSYGQLLLRCFLLGEKMSRDTRPQENVGLMLPNSLAIVVAFFALQAYRRVPTMLNFTSGVKNIRSACSTALVKTVYTSRQFVQKASLQPVVEQLRQQANVIYLEDLAQSISLKDKLKWVLLSRFPQACYDGIGGGGDCEDTAAILFTSGSEASPKGVALSHVNLQANRYQVMSRVDFMPTDLMFNSLPVFHSFALTGGMLLPVLSGVRTFLYPSPLDYRTVPELIHQTGATITFATDTFLNGYARHAHPYDFHTIRYVFAGAEKLKGRTLRLWMEKYGVRVFEGYGVTETSPVLAANTAMHNKAGTVGRFMPGVEHRLRQEEGIEEGGRLMVKGPNVMQGYIKADRPGEIIRCEEHDTGDVVTVDDEGYVAIVGRASRFAKVAGEMVSLAVVEDGASSLWPECQHAALALSHEDATEEIALVTTHRQDEKEIRKELADYNQRQGLSRLHTPKRVIAADDIPLTATGKTDYQTLQRKVRERG